MRRRVSSKNAKLNESSSEKSSSSEDDPSANEDLSLQIVAKAKAEAEAEAEAKAAAKKEKKRKRAAEAEAAAKKEKKRKRAAEAEAEAEAAVEKKRKKKKKRKKMEPNLALGSYVSGVDVNSFILKKNAAFELMSEWPWTIRAKKKELDYISQPRQLKIHGLFKSNNKAKTPNVTQKDMAEVSRAIKGMGSEFESLMDLYWPSLVRTHSPLEFWTHEFVKHGRPLGMLPSQYFALTLVYYHKLTTNLKFKTNREYTINEFLQKLQRHAISNMNCKHVPNLICVESTSINCMRKEATSLVLKGLVFKGLSTCIRKTQNNGMVFTSSTKNQNHWGKRTERKRTMIIPYKKVGQQEGSETETENETP